MQRRIDPEYLGRVYGSANMFMQLTMTAGMMSAPLLDAVAPPHSVILLSGLRLAGAGAIAIGRPFQLKAGRPDADSRPVTRIYSICSLVAALAIGGYLLTAHAGQGAKAHQAAAPVIAEAGEVAGASSLREATLTLSAHYIEAGTYAGAVLSGATLVRADASTYCMQAGTGTTVVHQANTDTESVPGPC